MLLLNLNSLFKAGVILKNKWEQIRAEIREPIQIYGITDLLSSVIPLVSDVKSDMSGVSKEDIDSTITMLKKSAKRKDRLTKLSQEQLATKEAPDKWDYLGLGTNLLGGMFSKTKFLGAIPLVGTFFNIYEILKSIYNAREAVLSLISSKQYIKLNKIEDLSVSNLTSYFEKYKDNPDALLELVSVSKTGYAFWGEFMNVVGNLLDFGKDILFAVVDIAGLLSGLVGAAAAAPTGGASAAAGGGATAMAFGIDIGLSILFLYGSGKVGEYLGSGFQDVLSKIDKQAELKLSQPETKQPLAAKPSFSAPSIQTSVAPSSPTKNVSFQGLVGSQAPESNIAPKSKLSFQGLLDSAKA